jgi:hypothetical protein
MLILDVKQHSRLTKSVACFESIARNSGISTVFANIVPGGFDLTF